MKWTYQEDTGCLQCALAHLGLVLAKRDTSLFFHLNLGVYQRKTLRCCLQCALAHLGLVMAEGDTAIDASMPPISVITD